MSEQNTERWRYSPAYASLYRQDKFFAIVTPDGQEALEPDQVAQLMADLNQPSSPSRAEFLLRMLLERFHQDDVTGELEWGRREGAGTDLPREIENELMEYMDPARLARQSHD